MYVSDEGGPDWTYSDAFDSAVRMQHGHQIHLGNITVEAVHTPGHTPEHMSFLITDGAQSPEPGFMLTGDFVFVGELGRPDLLDEAAGFVDTRFAGAKDLYTMRTPRAGTGSSPMLCTISVTRRVWRLCKVASIQSVITKRKRRFQQTGAPVGHDLVERDFTAENLDARWLTDITEHWTAAAFRISFARRNSAFSRRSRLISTAASVATPGRSPASTCCRRIQVRNFSGDPILSICATAVIAAYLLG